MFKKIFLFLLLGSSISLDAQTGTNFSVDKSVIASGGGQSTGAGFSVTGTVGQSVATQDSTGTTFALSGGFWASGPRAEIIFKDGFEGL